MDTTIPTNSLLHRPVSSNQAAGDWRLSRLPKARVPLLALALSVGLHSIFLLAFNRHGPRIVLTPMPIDPPVSPIWTNEPETPPPTDLVSELKEPPQINVPRILDTPRPVDVTTAFVQPLEKNAPVDLLNGDRILKIPTNVGTGDPKAGNTPPVFDPSQLDRAPRAIAQPAPRYPHELQDSVGSAEVVVEFIVDTSGSVRGATIISSTHPGFERAALEGVSQWKFRPGIKDGRKVNARMRQPLLFNLEETPGT